MRLTALIRGNAIRNTGHNRATYMSKTHHVLQELVIIDLASTTDNAEESFFKSCDQDNELVCCWSQQGFPLKYYGCVEPTIRKPLRRNPNDTYTTTHCE